MKFTRIRHLILITTVLLSGIITKAQWNQLGLDIDGEADDDRSGWSVSSSADGLTVAIGAIYNDGIGPEAGHVRVYKYLSGVWTQLGLDIDGETDEDRSGYSVSLSADGSTVAIGAAFNDGNGYSSGHVRVYEFISGVWTQLGADIDGEAIDDHSGWSVSLSADSLIVAIGAENNSGNGFAAGHVRVYKFISGVWSQLGADIDGEEAGDRTGFSLSLSADGSSLAIGAVGNQSNGIGAGHVRVYKYLSGIWIQQGADIDGEAGGDQLGFSVSLSADGSFLAAGARGNDGNGTGSGHVRVYEFISGVWTQLGADIDGEAAGDQSGRSVSLSADGSTVAIGAELNSGNGIQAGHVRVYKFISGVWIQQGMDIDGEVATDRSGVSVSLSADGSTLAVGAHLNSENGPLSGHVRVYGPGVVEGMANNSILYGISIFPNPTPNLVTIALGKPKDVGIQVYNMTGQLVYDETGINAESHQIELNEAPGVYFIEIRSKGETQLFKLVRE